MNWYAMKLDGQMRSDEMIRRAAEWRRAAAARLGRNKANRSPVVSIRRPADSQTGLLHLFWRRLTGARAQ